MPKSYFKKTWTNRELNGILAKENVTGIAPLPIWYDVSYTDVYEYSLNRCFNTIVDNSLVSERTPHGTAFKRLYDLNIYTAETLNQTIQNSLDQKIGEQVSKEDKPNGNLKRYPVGTVVDLPVHDGNHYIPWALSTFDKVLKAHTTMCEYATAVQKLVEACSTESEGYPVVLSLVGTGLSRIEMSQQDIATYLINVFKANERYINCDIHIIVRNKIKNEIVLADVL